MAIRARLTAPRETREEWPWHDVESTSLSASLLFAGDRRMEAENFLAPGFAMRHAITSKSNGWTTLSEVARTWQPSRLKGIQVSPDYGTPFLAATQVYDVRPVPRKWLSLDRTSDYAQRYVHEGTILLTCSGSVGRATLADNSIADIMISHDLLRIDVDDERMHGWVYAYLRSPTIRAMMKSAQYGHMIKHLETGHLDALPIVVPSDGARLDQCTSAVRSIVANRNRALEAIQSAESDLESLFPALIDEIDSGEYGFIRRASDLFEGRRRFDAFRHNPIQSDIDHRLSSNARRMESLREIGCEIWLPNRFKRVEAEDGVDLIDSSSIFEINPDYRRRISSAGIVDRNGGFVDEQWLLMSRSGQIYGLLGSVAMATSQHRGKVVTDDVIRIAASEDIHPGYLHLALTHEVLGRPRVKSLAYGSSIPHIEVEDLYEFRVPRIDRDEEERLGNLVTSAFENWADADRIENALSQDAENFVQRFIL